MPPPQPKPPSRIVWALLVALCLALFGFVAGTAAGTWFVPAGSGLAAGAIVLGYGILGAALAGALGGLVGSKAPVALLRRCGIALGALTLLFVTYAVWRIVTVRNAERKEMGLDIALPPGVDFVIHSALADEFPTRSYREMTLDGNDWSFEYIAVGPNANECSGSLKAEEVEALLAALAAVRTRLASGEGICVSTPGPTIMTIEYTGDGGDWSAGVSMPCTQRERELMALDTTLRRIPMKALDEGRLNCEM